MLATTSSRDLLVGVVFTLVIFAMSPAVLADYAILRGAPITQGQMRIHEDDLDRFRARAAEAPDRLILKATRVEAEVAGVLARVRVSQVFQNPYSDRLEAIYVFPLPENAAVDRYSFQIGDRIVVGEIKEKKEARRAYEQARDEGRKAALLEQERANVFSQSVANIPPDSEIVVRIEYVHPLDIDGDRYVFRFPMVVGPRYIPGRPSGSPNLGRGWAADTSQVPDASRITPQHLAPGMRSGNDVFISAKINAGMPIKEVVAVTHELDIQEISETELTVSLKNQSTIADKDFVVEYRLSGPDTVLASLTHRPQGSDEGYLLLVLQPKWQIQPSEYAAREVILLLDKSGSMGGTAISQLRMFAQHVLDSLNPQDHFRIVAFSNYARDSHATAVPATSQNITAAKAFVRSLAAGGGTEMLSALELALMYRHDEHARPRYLIFLTDALVGNDDSILGYLQQTRFADTRVFPVAFGAAPNDYLIRRMAELHRGFAMQITNQDNPGKLAERFSARIATPYMTDLEIDWGELGVTDLIPTHLPDLYAGRPLVVMGRYQQAASGDVRLRGNVLGKQVEMELPLMLPEVEVQHDSIPTLWARQRIRQIWNRDLGESTRKGKEEITRLGLTHGLVTQYTSFVAVEKELPPEQGKETLRKETVPVMLPEGMTDKAGGQAARPIAQTDPSQRRAYVPNSQVPAQSSHALPASGYRGSGGAGGDGGGCGAVGIGAEFSVFLGLGIIYALRRRQQRSAEH